MKWVTRERPKIDLIACPWLIKRFIDKDPEFPFVPAPRVLAMAVETGAVPYDVPDVELTHVGELYSFDAFLQRYQLTEPGLTQLAVDRARCGHGSTRARATSGGLACRVARPFSYIRG